ncbi:MAG TPA: CDP-alcohol phosphatidyltransferase family protein [Tenuifilaceae bacterium]|nr:CDP-alcohol phosphatidyltransferase family protein [Tenuifilaceae bacterium]
MNKKHIPNILSISRIFLSLLLPLLFKIPLAFIALYLITGITDILDGFIARRYKWVSALGSKLDSIGDFVFYVVLITYLLLEQSNMVLKFLTPVIIIFMLKIGNIIVGLLKHKKLIMIHTIANKVTGFLVFTLPIMLILEQKYFMLITVITAFLSAIEELIILLQSSKGKVELNRKSIFSS